MAPPDDEHRNILLRAFGNLEGTVASMATQWRAQEKAATESRRNLYEKFEELLGRVSALSNNIGNVQQDVAELKNDIETKIMPSIEAYTIKQAEKRGAQNMGKLLWVGLLALVSAASYGIHQLLQWVSSWGKP